MFRSLYDALVRLVARPARHAPPMADLTREVRAPDPYVWRLPDPRDARWRRWSRRSRATGRYPPFPHDEPCWQTPSPPAPPAWRTRDDVVRAYVRNCLTPPGH